MDKFTDSTIQEILDKVQQVLKPIASYYGITFDIVEPKFSDIYAEATLSINLTGKDKAEYEERKRYFIENCDSIGLSESHWDYEFEFPPLDNHKCKVYSIDFHNSENPIIIQDLTTMKLYRTSPMFFLNAM